MCAVAGAGSGNNGLACEQWQNPRYVPHPYTVLYQQRRKNTPPAGEPKKGEMRLREMTPEQAVCEKEEARFRDEETQAKSQV